MPCRLPYSLKNIEKAVQGYYTEQLFYNLAKFFGAHPW